MIYDGHAYCFPPPRQHGGFEDPQEFRRHLQLFMALARQQPCWRKADRAAADVSGLVDLSQGWSFAALKEAGFRTGPHGLVQWTVAGEDYVKQALPPWIVDFAYPAESLVAEMDYAGVDWALLHRTPYMGLANEFIADCVRRFPRRIQGLAYVEEWKIEAETDASIRKLERAIKELGLAGLQFMAFHRPLYGQTESWEGAGFEPFWDAVAALEIPVFFTIGSGASLEAYLEELRNLRRWMERYPEVRVVHTHGFPWRLFSDEEKLEVPEAVYETAPLDHPNFHIQILFAVFLQSRWDYPMPQIRPTLETMVERIGAERIMWGTDIPIVLLHWTYRQSLDYIRNYCDFIGDADMDLILGGNMARFMGLERSASAPGPGGSGQ